MKPRILVTNDDGIHAPGIHAAEAALARVGEVYTVAPLYEQSASSRRITLRKPFRYQSEGRNRYAVDGTPADCAMMALTLLLDFRPDLVVAGINNGPNLGENVYYSGTVAGAAEGAKYGIPAIAVSVDQRVDIDYGPAAEFTARLATEVLETGLMRGVALNVNVPYPRYDGVEITHQSRKISRNLMVDGSHSLTEQAWAGLAAGLQRQDHIIGIQGERLAASPTDYEAALAAFHGSLQRLSLGDSVTVDFVRPPESAPCLEERAPGVCTVTYSLRPFPVVDFIGFFLAPFLTGLVSFAIAITLLWLRPNQPTAILVSATCLLLALVLCGFFDVSTSHMLLPLWVVSATMLAALLVMLALLFPVRSVLLHHRPWLAYAPLGLGAIAAAALVLMVQYPPAPTFQIGTPAFTLVFAALMTFVLSLLYHRRQAINVTVRDQSNTVLIGMALSGVPVLIWIVNILSQTIDGAALVPFNVATGTPFAILAPISLAYAVMQYRVFDTDRILSQGITYTLMLVALVMGYFLLVFSASLFVTQGQMVANNPLFIGLTIFLMAVTFLPVRNFIQTRIDRIYYRTRHDFQDYIEIFTHEIARMRDVHQVVASLQDSLSDTLQPASLFVFVPDRLTGNFVAVGAPGHIRSAQSVRV